MKVSELTCPNCGELADECECEKRPVKVNNSNRVSNKRMQKEKDG